MLQQHLNRSCHVSLKIFMRKFVFLICSGNGGLRCFALRYGLCQSLQQKEGTGMLPGLHLYCICKICESAASLTSDFPALLMTLISIKGLLLHWVLLCFQAQLSWDSQVFVGRFLSICFDRPPIIQTSQLSRDSFPQVQRVLFNLLGR